MKPVHLIPCLALFALLTLTGCDHGHAEVGIEFTAWEDCHHDPCQRLDYQIAVAVRDVRDLPIHGAHIELIVADTPEIRVYGETGSGGLAYFSVPAHPYATANILVTYPATDWLTIPLEPTATRVTVEFVL